MIISDLVASFINLIQKFENSKFLGCADDRWWSIFCVDDYFCGLMAGASCSYGHRERVYTIINLRNSRFGWIFFHQRRWCMSLINPTKSALMAISLRWWPSYRLRQVKLSLFSSIPIPKTAEFAENRSSAQRVYLADQSDKSALMVNFSIDRLRLGFDENMAN